MKDFAEAKTTMTEALDNIFLKFREETGYAPSEMIVLFKNTTEKCDNTKEPYSTGFSMKRRWEK